MAKASKFRTTYLKKRKRLFAIAKGNKRKGETDQDCLFRLMDGGNKEVIELQAYMVSYSQRVRNIKTEKEKEKQKAERIIENEENKHMRNRMLIDGLLKGELRIRPDTEPEVDEI